MAQWHKHVTVNATGVGSIPIGGIQLFIKQDKFNSTTLGATQNAMPHPVENGKQSVLTLSSFCLPSWSWKKNYTYYYNIIFKTIVEIKNQAI